MDQRHVDEENTSNAANVHTLVISNGGCLDTTHLLCRYLGGPHAGIQVLHWSRQLRIMEVKEKLELLFKNSTLDKKVFYIGRGHEKSMAWTFDEPLELDELCDLWQRHRNTKYGAVLTIFAEYTERSTESPKSTCRDPCFQQLKKKQLEMYTWPSWSNDPDTSGITYLICANLGLDRNMLISELQHTHSACCAVQDPAEWMPLQSLRNDVGATHEAQAKWQQSMGGLSLRLRRIVAEMVVRVPLDKRPQLQQLLTNLTRMLETLPQPTIQKYSSQSASMPRVLLLGLEDLPDSDSKDFDGSDEGKSNIEVLLSLVQHWHFWDSLGCVVDTIFASHGLLASDFWNSVKSLHENARSGRAVLVVCGHGTTSGAFRLIDEEVEITHFLDYLNTLPISSKRDLFCFFDFCYAGWSLDIVERWGSNCVTIQATTSEVTNFTEGSQVWISFQRWGFLNCLKDLSYNAGFCYYSPSGMPEWELSDGKTIRLMGESMLPRPEESVGSDWWEATVHDMADYPSLYLCVVGLVEVVGASPFLLECTSFVDFVEELRDVAKGGVLTRGGADPPGSVIPRLLFTLVLDLSKCRSVHEAEKKLAGWLESLP